MPTVSVIIPTRNDAPKLKTCLALLSQQSRPADEIIVVDNASSDDTSAICATAGVRRIPVDLPGIPATAAAGFDAAAGEIIARLDTDSRPPQDWLEHVERILQASGPLTAVTGPADFYGGNLLVRWTGRYLFLGGYFTVVGFLMGHPPVFGSNFALRRGVWAAIRTIVVRDNADVHDDFDISYRLRPDMTVIYDPTLRVGVSARPFASWSSFRRRVAMSLVTFRVEFAHEPPLRRRLDRFRWGYWQRHQNGPHRDESPVEDR
ncbi:glycosyltransferase family 2 protein [Pseudarthrobacter sp. MDT3-26]|uniref:glycosyltransferase family A protein n=1 Tax=Pseudarthrobacter raffinosi TaxID=2953651 RepID=UPI00208F8BEA|nr:MULTISPECIES: glycosyltransferase family A protein [unclassified Pseudarthrobacter]MCO4239832.1 glycosyltransferase family 2 protein [Pseudarthrobacter sp. MDT3-28]MCO4264223.1 glycosyltransferase family 2 protein [Pseudarthrobacter sp. MDT3-26]